MNKLVIRSITLKHKISFFLLCLSTLTVDALAADGPVAAWLFNKKGNLVKDISGNGHDGKISGKVEGGKKRENSDQIKEENGRETQGQDQGENHGEEVHCQAEG